MVAARSLLFALACLVAAAAAAAAPAAPAAPGLRVRRQLADDDALQPIDDAAGDDEQTRDKRKFEGFTQAKYGVKNAILGFVFGKINSLIDSKTRFIDDLEHKNIELNKQYGIEPPAAGGLSSLTGVIGQVIGPKLQLIGPKIQPVLGLIGGASGGSSGGAGGSGGGSGLGSILSLVTSLSGGSSGGGGGGGGAVATVDSSEEDDS